MGTVRRDQGTVRVAGNLADTTSGGWKTSIGYVGDYTPLFDHLSGARNLALHAEYYDRWSDETARSLSSRLLLDELATGLDPVVRTVFQDVLYESMQDERFTLLYATHHVSEIEPLADQLILDSGKVLRHEAKAELVDHWRRVTFRLAGEPGTIPWSAGETSA